MSECTGVKDGLKRRKVMNTDVYETPDPEVTFQPYDAVNSTAQHAHKTGISAEDVHFYDKSNVELDEEMVAPTKAFEVFMGKVYKPTALLPTQTEYEATGGRPSTITAPEKVVKELESPLTRFTRLSMEVKELEADLELLANDSKHKKHKMLVDAGQEAELNDVMQGLKVLQLNLAAIEQNAQFQPFLHLASSSSGVTHADAALALQKDLTAQFFQQIEALKRQQQGQTAVPVDNNAPIVYEIYSNGELNAVDKDAKTRMLALESRIATLEKAVGNFHTKDLRMDGLRALSSSGTDLNSLVSQLETRVNLLNEKNLDAIKTRTTALIHEFTLLNKLKESPNVQNALNSQADRDKIHQIYDKMVSIDNVAASVPAVIDRLVSLKNLHDDNLDMNGRVKKLEESHDKLAELLESDAAILSNMEKSLEENVQIFQSNIQKLDERMERLLHSDR